MLTTDGIDTEDHRRLLTAVLRHAMDDYVRLMHPKFRRKKYLQEAFQNAVDMFFDNEYLMLHVQNPEGDDMSLQDLLAATIKSEDTNVEALRDYLIDDALSYWDKKSIDTVYIPDYFVVDGHAYTTQHTDDDDYRVDYREKIVHLDKDEDVSDNQERFVSAVIEITLYHTGISISRKNMQVLSQSIFRTLKINDCFTGSGV